jgi:DASS family divalent anion:Na+ symporter
MQKQLTRGLLTVLACLAIWIIPTPEGVTPQAWRLFAILAATILGFILNPLPMGAVAFISISITVLTGTLKLPQALSGFANDSIWLIVSAFLFARGFVKTGLGLRIAYTIMRAIGDSALKLGYALSFSDIVMAPAMPSSAARAGGILFPIVRSLSTAFHSEPGPSSRRIGAYLIQTVYQTEATACAMFMTSMAGNPLIVTLAAKTLDIQITWGLWALASLVPALVSIAVVPYFLYRVFPPELKKTPEAKVLAADALAKMGPMSMAEKVLCAAFLGALALWGTAQYNNLPATLVAMLAVSVMLIGRVLDWKDVISESGAWDTMIWMGSLITLAGQLSSLGFIPWFANVVSGQMTGINWVAALAVLILVYMYSHYGFASLTAHITAMYAAFIAVAAAAGAPPYLAALSLAFVANICVGITHYSGAPAPIYFGAGFIDQGTWWKLGFYVSVINLCIWIGIGSLWWKILGLW